MFPPTPNSEANDSTPPSSSPEGEPVWTYRGYRMRPGEFNTALVHFFRAEVQRANVWRQRLDTTTNWAVATTAAAITIGFTQGGHHMVILLSTLLVTLFLYAESRRYRYYELWSSRIRLLETDFYAAMLVPPFHPAADWAESLAESLLHPRFPISMAEAFGRRFRRNYLWIYLILSAAWLAKTTIIVTGQTPTWEQMLVNMSIGGIPGWLVLTVGLVFNAAIFIFGLATSGMHEASGEVLPRWGDDSMPRVKGAQAGARTAGSGPAWYRISRRRQQLMALIITDKSAEISRDVLAEMRRGVTALSGTGMFTGQSHSILLCALTVTEVNQLKVLVNKVDPNAFMIVSPAQEVLGRGFVPLHADQ